MMMPPDIGDRDSALLTDGLYQLVDVLAHGKILEVPHDFWLERKPTP
jgi:hypothetical protein